MATQAQITAVQQLYVGYLGRAADSAGLAFWADAIANGTATIASVATGFTLSNEYKAAYAGLDSAALVDQVYTNVLGRAADAEGKAYWVDALAKGTVTADTLVSFIVTNLGALDQATINNKVFVAQTYTDTVGDAYTPAGGAAVLVGVDSTAASVTKAITAINSGTLPGQVPALGLINAVAAAQDAKTAFETAGTADADALVAKLAALTNTKGANGADAQTATDLVKANANATYQQKITAIVTDADQFRKDVSEKSTAVLTTEAGEAATAVTTALGKLTTAEKALANKYTSAIAAEATAKAGVATGTEKGAAIGGLQGDEAATTALSGTTASAVYTSYVNGTAEQRAALDTKFAGISSYTAFKAAASKDAAYVDAVKATAAAKDALDLTPTDTSGLQAAYAQAQANEATAKDALVGTSVKTAAQESLTGDADATAVLAAHNGGSTAADVYAEYVAGNATVRAGIDTEFAGVAAFTQFKNTAVLDSDTAASYAAAQTSTIGAKAALDAAVAGSDTTGSANGTTYVKAVAAQTVADKLVADAQKADANKVAAHAADDAYAAVKAATTDAQAALDKFSADGVTLTDLVHTTVPANSSVPATANKDVFYFTDKLAATSATPDFKIGSFGAGDSIVLGSGYTYNSGALSTGDNNKTEFFLVKSDAGVQIVLEGANYGSSEVKADPTTGAITSTAADHAQIITLTGVTLDHVAVANGVVSYV